MPRIRWARWDRRGVVVSRISGSGKGGQEGFLTGEALTLSGGQRIVEDVKRRGCRVRVQAAVWLGLACLVWPGAEGLLGQGARRGPPIQFSEPQADLVVTNLNRLHRGERGEASLEEQLQRRPSPFQSLGDPLRAPPLIRPPAGPAIQNPRVRELLERQRASGLVPGSDPLEGISGLEGEHRLRQNPLESTGRRVDGSREVAGELWSEFAELLENDPELAERLVRASEGERLSANAGAPTPGARAARARTEELAEALRRDGENRSLVRQLPGLTESVWQSQEEEARWQHERWRRSAREQRLEQFRAGLEAVATTSPGGLDSVRAGWPGMASDTSAGTVRGGSGPLWLQSAPSLWRSGELRAGGVTGITPWSESSQSKTLQGPLPAENRVATGSATRGGTELPAVSPAPVERRSVRGPNMPSPFTEIPKRPGF